MGGLIIKFRTWWETADRNQKVISIGGVAFFALILAVVFVFATKPKMSIAFAGLSPADTGMVASEIQTMGIPVDYDSAGNVSVPSDKIAQIKATLAMNGKLPRPTNHMTKRDLKDMPVMSPPRVEEERLQAINEGELAESIEMFTGVDSAQVHLTQGNDSPLLDQRHEASANVTIGEKSGAAVTPDQGRAMAMLVASSVPGLDPSKVSIFSRDGRSIWDGQEVGTNGHAATKIEMEKQTGREIRDEIQDQLNRIVGTGNALASVDVTLDLDKVSSTQNITTPTDDPITKDSVKETMGGGASTPNGGPAGAASNTSSPGTPAASNTQGNGYISTQTHEEKATSQTVRTVENAPGNIKTMGITILVNSDKVTNAADIQKIQDLANAKLGPKVADTANFTAKVISYKFDNTAQVEGAKATDAAKSSARMQQILSMLPIFALIIVAFLVMRALGKMGKTVTVPQMMLAGAGGPMLPAGSLATQLAAQSLSIPEEAVQKALSSGMVSDELAAALAEAQRNAGPDGEALDIPSIGNKVNVPLEQIKKMSQEKPDVVAMLIKSWLLEEGIRR